MTLYTTGKTAKENAKVLQKVTKTVFKWVEENTVQFNNSKSELIHFCRERKDSIAKVMLSNKTLIKSVN